MATNSPDFRIDRLLQRMAPGADKTQAKTASEQPATNAASRPAPVETPLSAALASALDETQKTAAEAAATPPSETITPVQALEKMASEALESQHEMRVKQAKFYGKLLADEAIAHIGSLDKLASARLQGNDVTQTFSKVASEQPELVKEAAQLGYQRTKAALEKHAAEAFIYGQELAYKLAHEAASAEFIKAAQVTNQFLRAAQARR